MKLTRQHVDLLTTAALLSALAGSFLQPGATWPNDLAFISIVVAMVVTGRLAPEQGHRPSSVPIWLAPGVLLAMAAQLIILAAPAERDRAILFGGAFAVAAAALFWIRRRAR